MSRSLAACGWASMRGQGEQVVEAEDAEGRRPLEQQVEQVVGGEGVVEGAVGGLVVEPQPDGQGAEAAVRDLVAHEAAGEGAGVDRAVAEARPGRRGRGRRRGSARSKRTLWPTITASPTNSTNAGRTSSILGAGTHHRLR